MNACVLKTAIEFLLLAKLTSQAWELAQTRDRVDSFVEFLSDDTPADELKKIGEYYETRQKISKAGDMFLKADLFNKAVSMYMQVTLVNQSTCCVFCEHYFREIGIGATSGLICRKLGVFANDLYLM